MARAADGAWRLHRDLVAVTPDLHRHAQRRVKALRPTETGRYEFARANVGVDDLGLPIFDLFVRWQPTAKENHGRDNHS